MLKNPKVTPNNDKQSLKLNKSDKSMISKKSATLQNKSQLNKTNKSIPLATEIPKPSQTQNLFKKEKKFGYVDEYFRNNLDDSLLCFKCERLYTDPIACYKCSKVYCLKCLDLELNTHSRCLFCFNIIFKEIAQKMNSDLDYNYKSQEVKCPYVGYLTF